MNASRACTRCKRELGLDCFYNDAKGPGGRSTRCKDCVGAALKLYRQNNREKITARKREENRTEAARRRVQRYISTEKGKASRKAIQDRSRRELQPSYIKRVLGLQGVDVPEALMEAKREQILNIRALRELKTVLADMNPTTTGEETHGH